MPMRNNFTLFAMFTFSLALVLLACPAIRAAEEEDPADQGVRAQVLDMYERAKSAGEQVPKDVYAWAKQDLGKIGDWEYLVTDLPLADAGTIQKRLNELGTDRWECIWIHSSGGNTHFIFKRPSLSYLKNIPLSQLMKLLTRGDSDN